MSTETPKAGGNRPSTNPTRITVPRDSRFWAHRVNSLPDDELIAVVRGINSVDRAVTGFRGRQR